MPKSIRPWLINLPFCNLKDGWGNTRVVQRVVFLNHVQHIDLEDSALTLKFPNDTMRITNLTPEEMADVHRALGIKPYDQVVVVSPQN